METTTILFSQTLVLAPEENKRLMNLCGKQDEHIRMIEQRLNVDIKQRGFTFIIKGLKDSVEKAYEIINQLYIESSKTLHLKQIHLYLQSINHITKKNPSNFKDKYMDVKTKRGGTIATRSDNQIKYIQNILNHDISFGVGPAGTGKTYLAVACAVNALETERVSRIILTRPIVEAGEKLGFLPGDLAQKVHPYLRPLYDALYEMMGVDTVTQLIERDIIELAPLAYMRGRSLNDAFIILDEGQNTTVEQMKMFLTRIGFNSKAVITGDVTQIDLNNRRDSGLIHTLKVLEHVKGISFTRFIAGDVVRHPLVQSIVEAYEKHDVSKNGDK